MSTILLLRRAAIVLATISLGASGAQAQNLAMAGSYGEANGIIVNIPQNPPILPCNGAVNDAQCMMRKQDVNGNPGATIYEKPLAGVPGAGVVATIGGSGTRANGLNVGDPFKVPTMFFSQMRGLQVGIVLGGRVIQLDTDLYPAMPPAGRLKGTVPALTRQFSATNWTKAGNGQNNGLTGTAMASRLAAGTLITDSLGDETVALHYMPGPNQFGGTMASLLDNVGRLYIGPPLGSSAVSSALRPWAATNPLGGLPSTEPNGYVSRNGNGWDFTQLGGQRPGRIKGPAIIGPPCALTPPPTPAGCNEVDSFDTVGMTFATFGEATSTKHVFAWTTGTVTIIRTAVRGDNTFVDYGTAMGYDTIGTSRFGGHQRNVGLVAGSYTRRTSIGTGDVDLNIQTIGLDVKFAPEPQPTIALIGGLGLLGGLAVIRRRR